MTSLALLLQSPAMAVQNVLISWNPSPVDGVAGYKIYSGGASGVYTNVMDAGNATSTMISGLAEGSTNYFSATTYDAANNESAYSTEVVFVAPSDSSVTSSVPIDPGQTNQTTGLNLVGGLMVTLNPNIPNSVILSWNASTDVGVAGYQIFSGSASGNYSLSQNIGLVNSLVFTGLVAGATSYYAIKEFDTAWNESQISSEISYFNPVVTNQPAGSTKVAGSLNPVANLVAQVSPTNASSVLVSWNASSDSGVTGYKVYWGASSLNYSYSYDAGLATNLTLSGLTIGSTNYLAVTEYDAATNESVFSSEVAYVVTPPPYGLNIVSGIVAAANPGHTNSAIISWNASTDPTVAGYQIFYGTVSGHYMTSQNLGLVNSFVINGLVAGTTNFFAVREYDSSWNESSMSPEASWYAPLPPPTLNALGNLSLNINAATENIALAGISSGTTNKNQVVKITVTSGNTLLIPAPKITYTSPKATGTLTFKPTVNQTGTATITVTVNSGNNSVTRSFTVTVINQALLAAMPKFTKQPKGSVTLPGKAVSLGVTVAGKAPFRYQWRFNGTNLPGATASTLSFAKAKATQAGVYSVLVSNGVGATNSIQAQLYVITNTAPSISLPISVNGQFSFQVNGVPGYKYVVTASTNLVKWTAVETNVAPFIYTDLKTGSYDHRYYQSYYLP